MLKITPRKPRETVPTGCAFGRNGSTAARDPALEAIEEAGRYVEPACRSNSSRMSRPAARRLRRPAVADAAGALFFLDDIGLGLAGRHSGDHNRRGFGVQLATVRSVGTLLANLGDVADDVVACIAAQLDVAAASMATWAARVDAAKTSAASIALSGACCSRYRIRHDRYVERV
jgi:hypothetical protein